MDGQKNTILSLSEPVFMGFYDELVSNGLSVILLFTEISDIPDDDRKGFEEIAEKYGIKIDEGMPFEKAIEDLRKRKLGGKTLG